MAIGVVVVSYNSGPPLLDCLESLLAAAEFDGAPDMRVLVVDNASPENTLERLERWIDGREPWKAEGKPFAARKSKSPVILEQFQINQDGHIPQIGTVASGVIGFAQTGRNSGFAGGVNYGLHAFQAMEDIEYFWILNPDAATEPQTPTNLYKAAKAAEQNGGFAVLGGRTYYQEPHLQIQSDGGRVDLWTGRAIPINLGKTGRDVVGPNNDALDYIGGAHMFVSRAHFKTAGYMVEDYFLYFEEIDWCLRRKDLPLMWVENAAVHHLSGFAIGSATLASGPSPLSAYWTARNRTKFVKRWKPVALPVAIAYTLFKILQLLRRKHFASARAAWRGLTGRKA